MFALSLPCASMLVYVLPCAAADAHATLCRDRCINCVCSGSTYRMPTPRWLLALEGLPTIAIGLAIPACMGEQPATATWLSRSERRRLLLALEHGKHERGTPSSLTGELSITLPSVTPPTTPMSAPHESAAVLATRGGVIPAQYTGASPFVDGGLLEGRSLSTHGSDGALLDGGAPAHRCKDETLSMAAQLRATLHTPACALCCSQYMMSSALTNAARFFLPTLLKVRGHTRAGSQARLHVCICQHAKAIVH